MNNFNNKITIVFEGHASNVDPYMLTSNAKINKIRMTGCVIYDDGENIELFLDTANIPEDYNKKYLRPITYAELVYIAIYDVKDKYPGFLTRYPVTGLGGIYPTNIYVKTTIIGRSVNFKMPGYEKVMSEYPILTEEFVSSLSPHISHISRLGADLSK